LIIASDRCRSLLADVVEWTVIRTKEIRYAIQFFESLFPDKHDQKQLARLSRHLKPIQDALGSLNDFIAHQKMAAEAALEAPADNRRARAFTSGIILGREDAAVKPLMKAALREVRRLRQVRTPFG
jgi:CHAD domain-containing protein